MDTILAKISDRADRSCISHFRAVSGANVSGMINGYTLTFTGGEKKRCENKKKGDQCDDRGVYYSFMGPLYAVHPKNSNDEAFLVPHATLQGNIQSTSQKDIYTCVVRPGQLLD